MNEFNLGVVSYWRIYQAAHSRKVPQKVHAQSHLCLNIVSLYSDTDRPGPSYFVAKRIRTDNSKYHPAAMPPRRCVICKKNCRIKCTKYEKLLHTNSCFQVFHDSK